jgi:uncharacterized protein (UPF0276 family)
MIQLGIAISKTAVGLLEAGQLDVDYVQVYGQLGVDTINKIARRKPVMLHDLHDSFWLNYENPFREEVMQEARAMLDIAQSPWFSTGIGASAEPQGHRDGPYREAQKEDLQPRERVIENIVKHGRRLRDWLNVPLLLENFNYHPTNAYEYICEPELFNFLLDEIGCGMLLDLAHARISAHNMKAWGHTEPYLEALPLNKVREIHFTRPGWQGDQMVDLHGPVEEDDFVWLAWVLERAPVEAVTLEVEDMPAERLLSQIATMRSFLRASSESRRP